MSWRSLAAGKMVLETEAGRLVIGVQGCGEVLFVMQNWNCERLVKAKCDYWGVDELPARYSLGRIRVRRTCT